MLYIPFSSCFFFFSLGTKLPSALATQSDFVLAYCILCTTFHSQCQLQMSSSENFCTSQLQHKTPTTAAKMPLKIKAPIFNLKPVERADTTKITKIIHSFSSEFIKCRPCTTNEVKRFHNVEHHMMHDYGVI